MGCTLAVSISISRLPGTPFLINRVNCNLLSYPPPLGLSALHSLSWRLVAAFSALDMGPKLYAFNCLQPRVIAGPQPPPLLLLTALSLVPGTSSLSTLLNFILRRKLLCLSASQNKQLWDLHEVNRLGPSHMKVTLVCLRLRPSPSTLDVKGWPRTILFPRQELYDHRATCEKDSRFHGLRIRYDDTHWGVFNQMPRPDKFVYVNVLNPQFVTVRNCKSSGTCSQGTEDPSEIRPMIPMRGG